MAFTVAVEHLAHGEDGAAEITQQQHAIPLIGSRNRRADEFVRRPEATILIAAGRLDMDVGSRHLTGKEGQTSSQLGAM
jgi:hypothetical protein